jgi:2-aminoadipate transaminase
VIDRPTFPGAIQAFQAAGAQLVEWDTEEWSLEVLERLLIAHHPKLIFTMPTFHNPTARTMDEEQRTKLLELAARYRVPVIEDDVYSRTLLHGAVPPSLYRMDKHNVVIYLSTFSKVLAPGLRLGWIAAPPHMVKQLSLIKMRSSLFTEGLL